MKNISFQKIIIITIFAYLIFNCGFAEIPHLIQYQGKATEKSSGLPLSGNHNITLRIYDSPTTPTHLWQEQHVNVPVTNGNFSILMGSAETLDLSFELFE